MSDIASSYVSRENPLLAAGHSFVFSVQNSQPIATLLVNKFSGNAAKRMVQSAQPNDIQYG
jgi:adenosine/AMP kinase